MNRPSTLFRCSTCGYQKEFPIAHDAKIRPAHCNAPMYASTVRVARDSSNHQIEIVADRGQPWRIGEMAVKRKAILDNHPGWSDIHQVWDHGLGRLVGSEFIAMIGKAGDQWEYDVGAGVPWDKRWGTAASREEAAVAAVMALDA